MVSVLMLVVPDLKITGSLNGIRCRDVAVCFHVAPKAIRAQSIEITSESNVIGRPPFQFRLRQIVLVIDVGILDVEVRASQRSIEYAVDQRSPKVFRWALKAPILR